MAHGSLSPSPVAQADKNMADTPRDRSLSALHARQAALEDTIAELTSQRSSLVNSLSPAPSTVQTSDSQDPDDSRTKAALDKANLRIKAQISRLQDYNDIKDIGTQLMGLIAESRGCRVVQVQEEFGIGADD